jgi:2-hydroxycyclohexanecarboxyl-CoA dehydrogenase
MSGDVAVVTGAASGIGASIAAELSDRGWRVAGLDLRPSDWDLGLVVDVSDAASVADAVGVVEKNLGPVGAVVSAAGHYAIIEVGHITPEQWHTMLRVHLGGLANLCRAVLPGMTARGPLIGPDSPWRDPEYLATLPLRRLVAPEEIALTVAYVVEEATFMTGEIVSPNAGAVI